MRGLTFKSKTDPVSLKKFLAEGQYKDNRELAFATWVSENDGAYLISHHNSIIAQVEDWRVLVANCGYDSSTTRDRINTVLRDNNIPFYVAQKGGNQVLFRVEGNEHTVVTDEFESAEFNMVAGVWEVTV
jgi:hypothetical protein